MDYSSFYARFYGLSQKIGTAFSAVWRFRPNRLYFMAVGLVQALAWWQAVAIFRDLTGNLLVLHYNVDFGIDFVGNPTQIFWYPLYGLGIFIINLLLAAALHQHQDWRIFDHLLFSAALVFGLFLNAALLFVYLINFK